MASVFEIRSTSTSLNAAIKDKKLCLFIVISLLDLRFSLISCGQMCSDILIMYKGLKCYKPLLCWEHEEIILNGVHALLLL